MANRNIDLTSAEWRDMIFAGKNQDFGAYQLRKASDRRHNMAFLYMLLGLAVIVVIIVCYSYYSAKKAEEEANRLKEERERMRQLELRQQQEQPQEEPEEEDIKYEEPEIEVPEDVVTTAAVTEIAIVEKVTKEMMSVDEKMETEAVFSNADVQGNTTDATKGEILAKEIEAPPAKTEEKPKPKEEQIFVAVEQQAEFPGGQAAMMKWLGNNIRYPESAQQNDIQGKVIVKFVVEKDGSIGNVVVVKGVDKDLDREAVRVVKKMPKWQPGKNNGVPVRSYFNLPVTFRLQNQ